MAFAVIPARMSYGGNFMSKGFAAVIALAAGGLVGMPSANATLMISVFDNGVQIGSTVTSATGSASFSGSDASFSSVTANALGNPLLPMPDLSSNTLTATAAAGFTGTHVLRVDIVQSGLSFPTGTEFATGTFNALIGGPGPVTENTFVNGALVVSQTMSGPAVAPQRARRPPPPRRRQTLCKAYREQCGNGRSAREIRPRRTLPADLCSPRRPQCTPRGLPPKHGSSSADARRDSRSRIFERLP